MARSLSNRRRFAALLVATSVAAGDDTPAAAPRMSRPSPQISFEANLGQVDAQVKFLARLGEYRLFLTSNDAVIVASNGDAIRMDLVGRKASATAEGEDPLPGKAHYLTGPREQWRTDIPTFAKVRYRGVYPGVDLLYYGNERELEYDFVVAPGADASQIEMRFKGVTAAALTPAGDVAFHHGSRAGFTLRRPRLYQIADDAEREVRGAYRLVGGDGIRFEVGDYDRRLPLVIDPILAYSTYLGTSSTDGVTALALDPQNNLVVLGRTTSTSFPLTPDAFQRSPSDVFVTKLNPSGTTILYSTYFGGSNTEIASDLDVDSAGNIYLGGYTYSADLPVANAFQPTYVQVVCNNEFGGICPDAFATKLNAAGSGLIFSTYLGGHGFDTGRGVTVDAAGNLYFVGATDSFDFPTRNSIFPGAAHAFSNDGFLAKFDPAGTLVYSSFISGSGDDAVADVAVDASGVYIAGQTTSSDFPVVNPIQATNVNFGDDAFVMKLNAAGTQVIYSTYLGGNRFDRGYDIDVDADGNAYVAGMTQSTNFPLASPLQPVLRGENDVFVAKLNSAGSALVYSTYLGGNEREEGPLPLLEFALPRPVSIDVTPDGRAYVSGSTHSADFPGTTPFGGGACQQLPLPFFPQFPCPDAFLTAIDPQGSRIEFSTTLGGDSGDRSRAVTVGTDGAIYVGGSTESTGFPTAGAPLQPAYGGGDSDGFVARFDPDRPACTLAAPTSLSYQFFTRTGPFRPVFSWDAVPGAETYVVVMTAISELVLTGRPTAQVIATVDERPEIGTPTLPAGDYAVVVVPSSVACGAGAPSAPVTLTMPQTCPVAPSLVSPVSVGASNPVRFTWTASPGASLYQLIVFSAANGAFVTQHASATNEFTVPSTVQLFGDYVWFVAAWNSMCGPAVSGPASFRGQ